MTYIDIVFDGPPSHNSGRFVEMEDHTGKSISPDWVPWVRRSDGYWVLRIPVGSTFSETLLNRVRAEALREARDNVRASSFWADGSDNYAGRVRGYLSNAADRIEQNSEGNET